MASEPELRETIYLGAISLIIPMVVYRIEHGRWKRKKKKRIEQMKNN